MLLMFTGLMAVITSLCSVAGFHILTIRKAKYASTTEIIVLYLIGIALTMHTVFNYRRFLQNTKDLCRVQEAFLKTRLNRHANTEYGKRHLFKEISNVADYRSRHPLTDYNHYREDIQREADGERGILVPEKPAQIALSSGTTGKPKMILTTTEHKEFPLKGSPMTIFKTVMDRLTGTNRTLQRFCFVYVDPNTTWSKSGIIMSSTTKYNDNDLVRMKFLSTTPPAGFRIKSEQAAYYVHALFSLRDRNLGAISGYFSSVTYSFFRCIETQWNHLVDDIDKGTLNPDLDLPSDIRRDLEKQLVPDNERASELKREFQRGFEGFVRRVWPFMSCVICITSGSFSVYADILRERYCKGQ